MGPRVTAPRTRLRVIFPFSVKAWTCETSPFSREFASTAYSLRKDRHTFPPLLKKKLSNILLAKCALMWNKLPPEACAIENPSSLRKRLIFYQMVLEIDPYCSLGRLRELCSGFQVAPRFFLTFYWSIWDLCPQKLVRLCDLHYFHWPVSYCKWGGRKFVTFSDFIDLD